jgi:hypothetical protein
LVCLAGVTENDVAAAPKLIDTGSAAVSGGSREIAYGHGPGIVRIRDVRSGKVTDRTVPTDCSVTDAAFEEVLLGCGPLMSSTPAVLPMVGGKLSSLTPPNMPEGSYTVFDVIGRNWIGGTTFEPRAQSLAFVNWRTGATAREQLGDPARNLGTPGLAPLRRCGSHRTLRASSAPLWNGREYLRLSKGRVLLQRCGHRIRTLHKCAAGCAGLGLTKRFATWAEGDRVAYAYDIAKTRLRHWRFPQQDSSQGLPLQVEAAADRVFVSTITGPGGQYTIYQAG